MTKSEQQKISSGNEEISQDMEKIKQTREIRYQSIFILLMCGGIALLAAASVLVHWLVFMPVDSSHQLEQHIAKFNKKKNWTGNIEKMFSSEKQTAFTVAADDLLRQIRKNNFGDMEILRLCDTFFMEFRSPKNDFERKKLFELLKYYIPADEKRCEEARNKFEKLKN